MRIALASFLCGVLFGAGLAVSGMTDPARVVAFLDITGNWDPTLGLVMGGALAVTAPGFALVRRRRRPVLTAEFRLPTRARLDARLLGGAAIFGVGWGLAGLCPGPALAGLVTGSAEVLAFVVAMIAGQWLALRVEGSPGG